MSSGPQKFTGQRVAPDAEILHDTVRVKSSRDTVDEAYLAIAREIFGEPAKGKSGMSPDWDAWHKVISKDYIDGIEDKENQSRLFIKLILEAIFREDKKKLDLLVEMAADFFGYKNNSDELKMRIAYFLADNDKFTLVMIKNFISSIYSWQIHDDALVRIIHQLGGERRDFARQLAGSIRNVELQESMLKILKK